MAGEERRKQAPRSWKQDPESVRADILKAARAEFAENGLAGARVQDIAARIKTSKRMIFYYFGDKEGLYRAVLEAEYASVRKAEAGLSLDGLAPAEALRKLVEFTFDHHRDNPEFIRLVMIENIHSARHLKDMQALTATNSAAIDQLTRICAAGQESGQFREDVSPLALHWQISAISFFNVANRMTFTTNFGDALYSEEGQALLKAQAVRSIVQSVLKDPSSSG